MREKFTNTGLIPVTDIQLDQNNYRLGPLDSQIDCIEMMFNEFGEKMVHIANHIAKNGLSPKPIVVSKDGKAKWVVRDGNRRMTVLKLLNNSAMVPEEYKKKFQNIMNNAVPGMIPNQVDCLTADESTIIEYRKLEHMGPQDGIGQVDWDARAKDNMQADLSGKLTYPLARTVCNYLEKKGVAEARRVSISNIQRLLQDTEVSQQLGFKWDGKKIDFTAKEDDVFNILKEIIIDFTNGGKRVKAIYYPEDRKAYIANLFENRGFSKPSPSPNPTTSQSVNPASSSPAGGNSVRTKTQSPRDRKRLIQRSAGLNVPVSESKISSIIVELSSKIDVQEAPIAASVLIRLILERSVDVYASNNKVSVHTNDKLHVKIEKAASDMLSKGRIDNNKYQQLKKMSNVELLISAHTLNSWIHNASYIPNPGDVCTFWDNIYFFLVECWK